MKKKIILAVLLFSSIASIALTTPRNALRNALDRFLKLSDTTNIIATQHYADSVAIANSGGGGSDSTIIVGGRLGSATLSSGTVTISVSDVTSSSTGFCTLGVVGGNIASTRGYVVSCSTGSLTITAVTSTGSTNSLDDSTVNYWVPN